MELGGTKLGASSYVARESYGTLHVYVETTYDVGESIVVSANIALPLMACGKSWFNGCIERDRRDRSIEIV